MLQFTYNLLQKNISKHGFTLQTFDKILNLWTFELLKPFETEFWIQEFIQFSRNLFIENSILDYWFQKQYIKLCLIYAANRGYLLNEIYFVICIQKYFTKGN